MAIDVTPIFPLGLPGRSKKVGLQAMPEIDTTFSKPFPFSSPFIPS
jgi:hypothetical protein